MPIRRLSPLLLLLLCLLVLPAGAAADQLTVDFETGPALRTPVTDEYAASAFVTFSKDDGFRPYRTEVAAGRAHSGTVVADVGGGLCGLETEASGSDCEFTSGNTSGRLSRTATAVTLFAGELDERNGPETAQLIGHRTNGTTVKTADIPLDPTGVKTRLSVSSSIGDIDSFVLTSSGGDLAIDDLSMNYPANSLPDIVPSTTNQVVAALAGDTVDVPLNIARVNGS